MSESYEYETCTVVAFHDGLDLGQPGPEWRLVTVTNVLSKCQGYECWETHAVWERKVVSDA